MTEAPTAQFEQLYTALEELEPLLFEQIRAECTEDPFAFEWNTDVADVTNPWPKIEDPGPVSIRDAIQILTGRPDVTTYLYSLKEFDEYADKRDACRECGFRDCTDKWCGLRGDDDDGELRPGATVQ